jgi:hypothetical protein
MTGKRTAMATKKYWAFRVWGVTKLGATGRVDVFLIRQAGK